MIFMLGLILYPPKPSSAVNGIWERNQQLGYARGHVANLSRVPNKLNPKKVHSDG